MNNKQKIYNYNEKVGCDLVNNVYLTNTDNEMKKYFNDESIYKYPSLIISNDKLKQQNKDIYEKYMDHGLLTVNNDPSCKVDFNIRNLNNATNLQEGYSRNIDLDSELKRINHITDKCYYDNYKYHPEEALKGNGLYCHRDTLLNNYTTVGKPTECAKPLDGQQYKSVIIPGHLHNDYKKPFENYMSSNNVKYGFPTTGDYAPTERLSYQGCIYPRPEIYKCKVKPFQTFNKCDNTHLDDEAKQLLNYKTNISGNNIDHYKFNGDINNQNKKYNNNYPCQRLFNNNTKRSTLRNFHNLYDINPQYLC
jgi:hypothetical protein